MTENGIRVEATGGGQTITATAYLSAEQPGDGSLVISCARDGQLVTLNLTRLPVLLAALTCLADELEKRNG